MRIVLSSCRAYDRESFDRANARYGFALEYLPTRLDAGTASAFCGRDAVCAFVNDDCGRAVLEQLAAAGTRLLLLRSAGYNHVDLDAAADLGIQVAHVPAYSPNAVAEHATALLLTLARKTHRAWTRVREGNFSLEGLTGFDIHGRTVGVIGTGRIGSVFARIMHGFGANVIACDPANQQVGDIADYVALDVLLDRSDIISLHCPLTPETRHMIDAAAFELMRPHAVLINTGRGALVDTRALVATLKSRRIGAVGLDVYEEEQGVFFNDLSQVGFDDDLLARLLTFPNVLVTAHQGFLTEDALGGIAATTLENAASWRDRGRVRNGLVDGEAPRDAGLASTPA
jgi:D-lactate dehydrogenase